MPIAVEREAGLAPNSMRSGKILDTLREAVEREVFPGAVLWAARRGRVVFHEAVGYASLSPGKVRMTVHTVFDLASLTKPVATATALMQLADRERIGLDDPVGRWIPEFSGGAKDEVTLRLLLNHASGLRAWQPYYKEWIEGKSPARSKAPGPAAKRFILDRICNSRLVYPPGTKSVYSDLGFILLGEVVERASGRPLNEYARREIFRPLGMSRTFFIPSGSRPRRRFAATERVDWRHTTVVGRVHDDHAWLLGGVAGHAGLFSTAEDLGHFSLEYLKALQGRPGKRGASGVIPVDWARTFIRPQRTPGSHWGLGWDRPSPPSSSGSYFSRRAFGHLGFTGTSLWIDPDVELAVVLLTNRVHPSRRNIRIRSFRPVLHDLVYREAVGVGEA